MAGTLATKGLGKPSSLVHATGIVMAATLLSAVFGLLREMLVAGSFGTTVATDAYFFSYDLSISLPEFLLAAMAAGLIPIYTRSKKEGQSTAFVSTVLNTYLLFLLLVALLVLTTAPYTVALLASGFDETGQRIASQMLRMLSPVIVLAGLWGCLRTILNAEGEFFLSTISQTFLSLGIIGAVILLADRLGIFSLPVGILVGSLVQVAWTGYWLARRRAFRYQFKIDLHDPEFRRFLTLLGPGLIGGMIGYSSQLIDKALASHLAAGSIASLGFAFRPMAILTRIAVYSFITALLPTLSWEAVNRSPAAFRATVIRTLGVLIFVTTPLSLLLAVLSVPIIQVLFERGRFVASSTASTANVFACLVVGLMPMAISVTLLTVFISLEDTKTPAFFGAGTNLIANIIFDLLLIGFLGAAGIALATSLKYVVSGAVLFFLLQRRLNGINAKHLGHTFGKTLVASLLAVAPVLLLTVNWATHPIALIAVGSVLSGLLYWLFSTLLGVPELKLVNGYLTRSVSRLRA